MSAISDLIYQIRHAIYGRDVRESIASAIEQCYEDATAGGDTNLEVIQARGSYNNLNARISADETAINKLKSGKRFFVFLGDSYGRGYTINDGIQSTNWILETASRLGLTLNTDYVSNAINGSGFARTASFYNVAAGVTLPSGISAEDVTDVVVCGGYNDHTADTGKTISGGIAEYATYVKTTYPNARLWGGFIAWTCNSSVKASLMRTTMRAYANNFSTNGIINISDCWKVLHDYSLMSSDGFHPLSSGHVLLGIAIAAKLRFGDYDMHSDVATFDGNVTYVSGVTYSGGTAVPFRWRSQFLSTAVLHYLQGIFDIDGDVIPIDSTNVQIPLFKVLNGYVGATSLASEMQINGSIMVGGTWYPGPITLKLATNPNDPHYTDVYVVPKVPSGSGWLHGQITRISLYPVQIMFPYEFC